MSSSGRREKISDLIAGAVLCVGDGYRAKNSELSDHGLPFARAGCVNNGFHFNCADCMPLSSVDKVGDKISHPGDVVFTSKGTVGRFAFVRPDTQRFVYSPQLCYWRSLDQETIDSRFLFYWMQGNEFHLQCSGVKGQTDMAEYVSLTDQRRMYITLPDISEQRAIAAILSSLDDKIELNRQMDRTLESMALAIFKSWFVDFDPVRAKMEGRQPYVMDADTAALFPDSFEESELGLVPNGWYVTRWGDVVTLEYGKSLRDYAGEDGCYPVYGTNGRIGSHSQYLCPHPGIIIGRKGAYRGVHYCNSPFYVIDTAFYVAPRTPTELRWAYYELLRQDINSMDSGSAIPSTSRDDFYALPVVVPPIEIQQAFTALLGSAWALQEQHEHESKTLSALRDTLLPKLISGEVRVGEAEKMVEVIV